MKPHFNDIINNLKKSDVWKIQFTIAVNCISSKDTEETHVMHSILIISKSRLLIMQVKLLVRFLSHVFLDIK